VSTRDDLDFLCAKLDAAERAFAKLPTSLDAREAVKVATARLAAVLGGRDKVAPRLKLWRELQRFEAEQARELERQVAAEFGDLDDNGRLRGCAGSFITDADGGL